MYYESLHIQIFSNNQEIEHALQRVEALERFEHIFLPTLPEFSPMDCADADIIILDVPLDGIPVDLRKFCASVQVRIVYCDRTGGSELEDTGLLDQFDAVWCEPLSEARLRFNFQRLLEQIHQRKDLWMARNLLDTTIDSVPDLIWYKDVKGAHLKVNEGFCRTVGKTKEECRNRGHYYIWDIEPDEYAQGEFVCLESEHTVMKAKKTCVFDEKIKGLDGTMLQFKTYKSPILDEDGALIGTMGIAHDVTDWKNQTAELNIILNSLSSPSLLVGMDDKIIMVNQAFLKMFLVESLDMIGNSYADWKKETLHFDRVLHAGESLEVDYACEGRTLTLKVIEETIADIFQQKVGLFCCYENITEHKKHIQLLENYKNELEADVQIKTKTIKDIQKRILISFSDLVTSRDRATGTHIRNTSKYVDILLAELRRENLFPELAEASYCDTISQAVPLHDIGKIALPDSVLHKPGSYTAEEYNMMKTHAELGGQLLAKTLAHIEDYKFFRIARDMAVSHHEKWDGNGYPRGLKEDDIPLPGRIMAVADVFDALISDRPYRAAMTMEQAYVVIKAGAGTQFDPAIVEAFIKVRPIVEKIVHATVYRL